MDVYNRKMPGGFFYVEKFVLAATAFFRIPQSSISASEGRTYLNMGFKMTTIIKFIVGTQAIFKLLSYYLFELSSKNRFLHLAIRVIISK